MPTFTKAGIAALGYLPATPTKTGAGILVRAGGGADAFFPTETGAGILVRSGGGSETKGSLTKTGRGAAVFAAAGVELFFPTETGAGVLVRTGGGASQKTSASGTTYTKTGFGDMGIPVSGLIYPKTGAGVLVLVASGPKTVPGAPKLGSGISPRSAGGANENIFQETAGGGTDAPEPPSLESDWPPRIVHIGSGAAQKVSPSGSVWSKSGFSIMVRTAGGVKQTSTSHTGSGIRVQVGSGADVAIHIETGAGILVRTGSGNKQGADPTAPNVADAIVATEPILIGTVSDPANGTISAVEDDQLVLA